MSNPTSKDITNRTKYFESVKARVERIRKKLDLSHEVMDTNLLSPQSKTMLEKFAILYGAFLQLACAKNANDEEYNKADQCFQQAFEEMWKEIKSSTKRTGSLPISAERTGTRESREHRNSIPVTRNELKQFQGTKDELAKLQKELCHVVKTHGFDRVIEENLEQQNRIIKARIDAVRSGQEGEYTIFKMTKSGEKVTKEILEFKNVPIQNKESKTTTNTPNPTIPPKDSPNPTAAHNTSSKNSKVQSFFEKYITKGLKYLVNLSLLKSFFKQFHKTPETTSLTSQKTEATAATEKSSAGQITNALKQSASRVDNKTPPAYVDDKIESNSQPAASKTPYSVSELLASQSSITHPSSPSNLTQHSSSINSLPKDFDAYYPITNIINI